MGVFNGLPAWVVFIQRGDGRTWGRPEVVRAESGADAIRKVWPKPPSVKVAERAMALRLDDTTPGSRVAMNIHVDAPKWGEPHVTRPGG